MSRRLATLCLATFGLATFGLAAPGPAEEGARPCAPTPCVPTPGDVGAHGRAPGPAPPRGSGIVATWRGGSLERADYESWLSFHGLEGGPEAIRERVFVESLAAISRERGAEQEPRTRLELEAARQQVLLPALRRHVVAAVTVSDEEVEALRRDHPEAFRKPRKLLLRNVYKRLGDDAAATRARMQDIHRRLTEGADFKDLARRESESQSRFRDGYLGFLDPEELPPAVAAAARGLAPGEISGVVEHDGGLTIFLCEDVREARNPTPDEVRSKLRANLLRLRGQEQWTGFQERLLEPGYQLEAEPPAELVALRFHDKKLSDLTRPEVEELQRAWTLGVLSARRAVELGLDREPETAAALRWQQLDVLARRELVRRVDERLREPSVEELRRRFDADPLRYREPASSELAVIHFGAEDDQDPRRPVRQAGDVARRLEAGEITFEEAARRYSTHPSAAAGGLIGRQTSRRIAAWGPVVTHALRQMSPGERSGLLRLESGLWIFELRARHAARPMTFETVEAQVRHELRQQQIRELESTIRQEHLETLGLMIF